MRTKSSLLAGLIVALAGTSPATATFPGKNGPIAFSHFPGASNSGAANFEIATIGLDSPFTPLPAQNPRKDNWPDWSPDGRQLLWWHQGLAGNFDVYKMNADGTGQANLTDENPASDLNAAWSPDGREIVLDSSYQTDTGFSELQVMDADGTSFRQLTHNGAEFDNWGQFSPDGRRIAWTNDPTGEDSAIYTMNAADGAEVQQVTPLWLHASLGDYSPDGRRIVFIDNSCSTCPASDIWVIDVDGTNLTRLTDTPFENEFRPGFSPDGRKITFASFPTDGVDFSAPADIYVMNKKGKGRTNLTNTPDLQDRAPDWGARTQGDDDE